MGTVVGQLTAQDPDANSTLTFTLVGGSNDNHLFLMDTNGTLKTAAQLDYESNSSYSIRAKVSDQNNSSIKRNFTVNVLNVVEDLDQDGIEDAFDSDIDGDGYSNEIELAYPSDPRDPNSVADTLPTNLILSNLEIMENQPVGTVVGQFSVSDPDPNDVSRVRLNENNVSDNQLFTIDANNTLRTAAMFDYENNASTFIVHAKVKQRQVGVFWEFFTLSLLDDPSDNEPTYQSPTGGYQTPDGNYSPPNSPDGNYSSPSDGYQTPDGNYSSPDSGYQSPNTGYQSPDNGYQTPDGNYQTPTSDYQTPDSGYQSPDGNYSSPSDGYETPDGNYSSPDAGYQTPDSEYQSPGGSSPIDDQNETTPPKPKEIYLPILQNRSRPD